MEKRGQYTLAELAALLQADLKGDAAYTVSGLASLEQAGPNHLAFLANSRYAKQLATTQAGVVIVAPEEAALVQGNALVIANPYLAYARVSQLFDAVSSVAPGVHPSAVVTEGAVIHPSAAIAAGVVVGAGCEIGESVILEANVVLGEGCKIGARTRLQANVTCYHDVWIGDDCLIHSGAVLGADGFGFAPSADGWVKIAQLGGVRIGHRVEIGACTTIDRGALEHTEIGDGVILDNQIQIAHNVKIGKNSAIAGCTAVAGSTKIGDRCTIAGACGITGHLELADGVHITAMSLVTKSITTPGAYSSGTGLMPSGQWKKNVVRFRQLDELARRLKSVEEQVKEIKGS
ncbi:UDP-3-O-(3-hydroxymyristoyl)glucosamine N-acyltransferase [Neptuniibacter sp. CAU 1671]|uniref:UDP-3-O-(3-hydroxymyristoyl)glucosamine N-acyltransferase n=1 Tax=Neptuniibacter sp. CAU 1671 TaxID=3032593 RepID=UPI0023DC8B04|nr:UDP-3-O-(3-hydroxymyristoyl)glucosamine N-acyltransferase [Neptuniibacter sp. CAU 1671]MDF2181773.1 UDP-3-O-(3-hydroxymyristoyl)glucosamine N-acyltransferase [Neptuniibacter sp. CAU 1671]